MNQQELLAYLQKEAETAQAKVSVLWKDMDADQELYAFAPDREMVSASTIKVLILLAALERVRQGRETLDGLVEVPSSLILEDTTVYEYGSTADTLDHLLRWMIILSDNTATNVLIHRLGMEEINAYGRSIGLRLSRVERVMLDFAAIEQGRNNYTSAREQCRMYELLLRRSILTPALCNYAMEVLLSQRSTSDFLRYIPYPLKLAHKTGGLDFLNHDAGLFFLENACYYLGVFVQEAPDDLYCKRLIGRISKAVYAFYKEGGHDHA